MQFVVLSVLDFDFSIAVRPLRGASNRNTSGSAGGYLFDRPENRVVSLSLRDGMAWSSNQPVSYPLTPAMATEMTVRVWTTAELLGYRVSATVLDKLADMKRLFPDSDF